MHKADYVREQAATNTTFDHHLRHLTIIAIGRDAKGKFRLPCGVASHTGSNCQPDCALEFGPPTGRGRKSPRRQASIISQSQRRFSNGSRAND